MEPEGADWPEPPPLKPPADGGKEEAENIDESAEKPRKKDDRQISLFDD
jgi:hypothetical protein